MTTRVFPQIRRRSLRFLSAQTDRMTSKHISVRIGTIPKISGTSLFSIGRVAMLEMRMVMTSSDG